MPSLGDSAFIFLLALILFGPKKLPELARQLGKLMAEFRRASNEFRMQMEDELRIADQAEQQKKIAAMEAAAPVTPALTEAPAIPTDITPVPDFGQPDIAPPTIAPLPIATEGELSIMPPSTGLPTARTADSSEYAALTPVLDAIPVEHETLATGAPTDHYAAEQHPDRHTQSDSTPSEAPING
jgi:sec-independent protein translocase protein TatB